MRCRYQIDSGRRSLWSENEQCIYWVDIDAFIVHRFDPATGENTGRNVGKKVGTVASTQSGKLVLGLSDGVYGFDFETEELTKHCDSMQGKSKIA